MFEAFMRRARVGRRRQTGARSQGLSPAREMAEQTREGPWVARSKISLSSGILLLASTGCGSGWTSPSYEKRPIDPPPASGQVQGLTVLVSFSDEAIGDAHAMKVHRAINQTGFTEDGNAGSVKDYFLDMSGGKLTVNSRVFRVQVPHPKAHYDRHEKDRFDAPSNATSLSDITVHGPSSDLLKDVLCRLRTCNGAAPAYQEVSASGISATRTSDLDFSSFSTRRLSFWPDAYVRDYANSSRLSNRHDHELIGIPDISIYQYVNLVYAGDTAQTDHLYGLWPRSVPSIATPVPGSSAPERVGVFQILGAGSPTDVNTGILIHETAHTLFSLPDLYDAGSEIGLNLPSGHVSSQGVGSHALMGSTGSPKRSAILSAPLRDRLGWANVIDIGDLAEGVTVSLAANGADIARYCRPDSPLDECFYLEVRAGSQARGPSGITPYTPDQGLVIWHSENGRNILDAVVNNHPEGTPGLHYEVALVQADGARDLEGPKGTGSENNDYFRAGHADRFDAFTVPSSRWWDGIESGLSIRNISAPGGVMTFEIGRRNESRLHIDNDQNVLVAAGSPVLRVGETRTVTVTPQPGFAFDLIVRGHQDTNLTGLVGPYTFNVVGSLRDNYIKAMSYPAGQAGPVFSARRRVKFQIAPGVDVTTYGEEARTYDRRSAPYDVFNDFVTFRPGQDTTHWSPWSDFQKNLEFRTYLGQGSARFFAKARPGFVLKNLDVYGSNHESRTLNDVSGHTSASALITVPPGEETEDFYVKEYLVHVNAEQIPGYFCRNGFVEQWRADKIYRDVGDKVRYGDFIYTSNVPRNFLRGNVDGSGNPVTPPLANPENSPHYWTRFASCTPYVADCSGAREWVLTGYPSTSNPLTAGWTSNPGVQGERVVFNGALFEFVGSYAQRHDVPGAAEHIGELLGANLFAEVEQDIPIYSNRAFIYRDKAAWKLLGNCSQAANWRRATVVPTQGVQSLTPQGVSHVQAHRSEPAFVTNISGAWSFGFDLEPGYVLDDVYVNGVAQGLAPSARAATIPFTQNARPSYIEVKTICDAACEAAVSAPKVSCTLGAPQHWNVGFVYPTVRVTNISGEPITGWKVLFDFAAPPDLWNSSGIVFEADGNQVVASNAYAWNGSLAPGASYQFSIGGNLSGPFVPPTCSGM